jgi:transposase
MADRETKDELPGDVESCHELIRELYAMVENLGSDVQHLKQKLQNQLRYRFGRSSEKLSPGQIALFAQELNELLRKPGSEKEEKSETKESGKQKKAKNGGGGRKPLPATLPRETRDYFPLEEALKCEECGNEKSEFGKEVTEQLDCVPATFKVIEHVVHKFCCSRCQEGVVEGKKPSQILNGGTPTEGVIARVITAKWADHLPLYRQEQIYAREGVEISRSSMGRWMDVGAVEAKPIVDRMHELILEGSVIQADETPVLFIDKDRPVKKGKQGYAWTYYGDAKHPYVLFDFQPDRCAERPKEILKGYSNFLLTDGYGGYDWYQREKSANCNIHLRRYLEKAEKYDKKKAGLALAIYSELYKIESRIQSLTESEILQARNEESRPLMAKLKELLFDWQISTPPKTSLGIAINYGLPRWDKFCRFLDHACLKMDTNLVENSVRPIALGRKNWMHVGSEDALETASVLASLVNTCRRLNVNTFVYLRDILIRLARGDADIDNLLPDKWVCENPLN